MCLLKSKHFSTRKTVLVASSSQTCKTQSTDIVRFLLTNSRSNSKRTKEATKIPPQIYLLYKVQQN